MLLDQEMNATAVDARYLGPADVLASQGAEATVSLGVRQADATVAQARHLVDITKPDRTPVDDEPITEHGTRNLAPPTPSGWRSLPTTRLRRLRTLACTKNHVFTPKSSPSQ